MACYEATCHAIWLRNFILASEVNYSISRLLKLFCDNSTTISFFRSTSLFKHIDVEFLFVKEKVAESLISVEHTPTTNMSANPLTKGLFICVFQEHALTWDCLKPRIFILVGVLPFHVFCKECSCFFCYYMHILTFVIIL